MKIFLFTASLIGSIALLVFLSSDFNRAGLLGSEGYQDSGSKFGITIGMGISDLERKLNTRGMKKGQPTSPGKCLGRENVVDQVTMLWDDLSWRRGVVCVSSKGGKVQSFAWSYGGWQF